MFWSPTIVAILLMRNFSQGIAANLARDPQSLRVKRDVEFEGGEEYKVCEKKILGATSLAIKTPDERTDFFERKICNFLTSLEEVCGKTLTDNGFSEDKVMRIVDKTIEKYVEELVGPVVRGKAWDYEKCPVVKTYKERKECEADYQACMDRTLNEFLENISDLGKNFDWRANYVERKSCNMATGVSECRQLMKKCHSDEFIRKEWDSWMAMMIEKTKKYPAWDSQKCPVFKEYLEQKAAAEKTTTTTTPSTTTTTTRRPITEQQQRKTYPASGSEYLTYSTAVILVLNMICYVLI